MKLIPENKASAIACAWELVERGAAAFLRFPDDQAKDWISFFSAQLNENEKDFKKVVTGFPLRLEYEQTQHLRREKEAHGNPFTELAPNPADYDVDLLSKSSTGMLVIAKALAATFYERVETETYIKSMELNFLDYRSVFTDSPCVHDPMHVMNRLKNPNAELTKEDRIHHFAENRAQSFSILAGMSAFEVKSKVMQEGDVVLASSNRYNSLKEVYADAAATEEQELADEPITPTVKLGTSLDGAII